MSAKDRFTPWRLIGKKRVENNIGTITLKHVRVRTRKIWYFHYLIMMVLHVNILYYYYTGISDNTCNITRPLGHNTLSQYSAAVTVPTVSQSDKSLWSKCFICFLCKTYISLPQRKQVVAALCSAWYLCLAWITCQLRAEEILMTHIRGDKRVDEI